MPSKSQVLIKQNTKSLATLAYHRFVLLGFRNLLMKQKKYLLTLRYNLLIYVRYYGV